MPFGALGRHPSAYVDINAWKAGIAERPEDYRWCSFAAPVSGKTTRVVTLTNASSEVTENRTEAFIDGSILSPETA